MRLEAAYVRRISPPSLPHPLEDAPGACVDERLEHLGRRDRRGRLLGGPWGPRHLSQDRSGLQWGEGGERSESASLPPSQPPPGAAGAGSGTARACKTSGRCESMAPDAAFARIESTTAPSEPTRPASRSGAGDTRCRTMAMQRLRR